MKKLVKGGVAFYFEDEHFDRVDMFTHAIVLMRWAAIAVDARTNTVLKFRRPYEDVFDLLLT